MNKIIILFISLIWIPAFSQMPTHCVADEISILNSKMGKIEKDKFLPNGKIVSLCADKSKEPFTKVVYRFGKLGAVEMEVIATPQSKMSLFSEQDGKTSDNAIWFKKGNFTYVINECMGMCSGLSLSVFQNAKKIAEMISPDNETFESNLPSIDFNKAKSRIFQIKEPEVKWLR